MSGNMAFFFDLVALPGGSTWRLYLVARPGGSTWWLYLVALPGGSTWWFYLVHLAPLCTTNYPPLLAIAK